MPISGESLNRWREDMSRLADAVMQTFESTFGYPPGDHIVVEADAETGQHAVRELTAAGIGGDLLDFYAKVVQVSFPDVENGFFIHSVENIVEGGHPTKLTGAANDEITVFGSDGGGGLFALNAAGDKVYRLAGGSLVGPVYEVDESGLDIVASNFESFLIQLRDQVQTAE